METYQIEILEPRAKKLLEELAKLSLIKVRKIETSEKKEREFGSMKGLIVDIADDFDQPLEDFKEYV